MTTYRIKFFTAFLLFAGFSLAQNSGKMNFELSRKIRNKNFQNQRTSVLIKGDVNKIKAEIEALDGKFKYASGDIAAVTIPIKNLELLAGKNYIRRIEARIPHIRALSDSMRIKANVNPVHAGQAPLTQGYDGTGVVIGFIDTGIDFTNPDFKDSLTGKTRLKFIWDQNKPTASNTPSKYGYGQEWNGPQIDAGLCTENDIASSGHGTASCGIAAGNGKGSPGHKYMGVAPAADLIVVALNFNSTSGAIPDAVDYIYSAALALGEPCVINLSVGDYSGSHDGKDLQAQLMDSMLMEHTGRAMVASAGNEGGQFIHLGYNLSATDTDFTWFKFNSSDYVIEFWADTLHFKNAQMAIGADKNSPAYSFSGRTKFISTSDNLGLIMLDTLYNAAGDRIAKVESNTTLVGGTYDISYLIIPDSNSAAYNWRLMLTGQGKFDLWDFGMVSDNLPIAPDFPSIIHYQLPDTLQTICSSYQCLDHVITVGNYDNKKTYVDFKGVRVEPFPKIIPGNIDLSSSIGPTRDGRIKPDIAAPGAITITTGVLSLVPYYDSVAPTGLDQTGYFRAGGTSAAGPVVAGVAALYLQKNPTADYLEVKKAILACPKTDSFTGIVPNNSWGYGKIDAFSTLTACVTGINPLPAKNNMLSIYPNPFTEQTVIAFDFDPMTIHSSVRLEIYDIIGKLVRTIPITGQTSPVTFFRGQLESGSYICNLVIDNTIIQSGKLQVM